MTLGFLNWPAAFPFRVFRNLTFAHIQDIFAIFDFEDEMFVEVFPWLDNIQKHAWYCKQLNRSYWGPRKRKILILFILTENVFFSHLEGKNAGQKYKRVKKRIIDLEQGVIRAKKA